MLPIFPYRLILFLSKGNIMFKINVFLFFSKFLFQEQNDNNNQCFPIFSAKQNVSDVHVIAESMWKTTIEFSEYSTIQGIVYVFSSNTKLLGKVYWLISICVLISLGLYWTADIYMSWQSQQVLYCIQVILAVLVLPFSIREVA